MKERMNERVIERMNKRMSKRMSAIIDERMNDRAFQTQFIRLFASACLLVCYQGCLVEGREFHKYYFDLGINEKAKASLRVNLIAPRVHLLGEYP